MRNIFLSLILSAAFGMASTGVNANTVTDPIACEHCAKDHKCDDKCKKGENSKCCAKAENKQGGKTDKACCKKGHKSCKSDQKSTKSDTENKS